VWACSLVLTALLAANLFGSMEMLRIFWDKTVALNPAADARDERHMPLSGEGELDTLWRAPASDVAEEALTIQTRFSSFDDYWLPLLEKQGPAGDYVATLTVGEREQLRLRLRKTPPWRWAGRSNRAQRSCLGGARHRAKTCCFNAISISSPNDCDAPETPWRGWWNWRLNQLTHI
jgi:hypothetical protein